jgi:hypothetical protein
MGKRNTRFLYSLIKLLPDNGITDSDKLYIAVHKCCDGRVEHISELSDEEYDTLIKMLKEAANSAYPDWQTLFKLREKCKSMMVLREKSQGQTIAAQKARMLIETLWLAHTGCRRKFEQMNADDLKMLIRLIVGQVSGLTFKTDK